MLKMKFSKPVKMTELSKYMEKIIIMMSNYANLKFNEVKSSRKLTQTYLKNIYVTKINKWSSYKYKTRPKSK